MLVTGDKMRNLPILSIQTGHQVATTDTEVIDPAHLTVVAYYIKGDTLDFTPALLRSADIREVGKDVIIINSSDDFVSPDDLITLKKVLELHFELTGMPVVDTQGEKIGKVARYTIEPASFVIQQLHVRRPLLKSFTDAEAIIHRQQIVAINDKQIIVRATDIPARSTNPAHVIANSFRPSPQAKPEARDISSTSL